MSDPNENMIKTPFVNYKLEEERQFQKFKVVSVKFNLEDYEKLQKMMRLIQQPKDSTAIKTLMELGCQVILDPKTRLIMETLANNKKNNKRTGLSEF